MVVFSCGSGCGWWLAILILASIKDKLSYSNLPKGLSDMGISFIITGLIAMVFMGLTGIDLSQPSKKKDLPIITSLMTPEGIVKK